MGTRTNTQKQKSQENCSAKVLQSVSKTVQVDNKKRRISRKEIISKAQRVCDQGTVGSARNNGSRTDNVISSKVPTRDVERG